MEVMQRLDAAGNGEQAISPTAMVMNWTPTFQSIAFGGTEFSHNGPIETHPSHDLAHLFVAASGNMPWVPEGDDATIRIAEYNTVMVERILDNTFTALITRRLKDDDALSLAVAHAEWFVNEFYAPFPISAEEAYHRFARDIDCEMIVKLSPYFFRMKLGEAEDREFRLRDWALSADAMTPPEIEGPVERKYVHAVRHQMNKLKTIESPSGQVVPKPATSPTAMVMNWTPEFQSIAFGETEFSHSGPIQTTPSHDLAHLLIAASGNMPWAPEGDDATIRFAEYNAVLIEDLLDRILWALLSRCVKDDKAISQTAIHAAWFVEHHYAPFPISAEEAFSLFAEQIDAEAIVRLSPYFFRLRLAERRDPEFPLKEWTLSADATKPPKIEGSIERKYVNAVRRQMTLLTTSRWHDLDIDRTQYPH